MAKKKKDKWFHVDKKLPEANEIVLCLIIFGSELENKKNDFKITYEESYMIVADRLEIYSDHFVRGKRSGYIVSYWRPLPKMPKRLKDVHLRTEYKE